MITVVTVRQNQPAKVEEIDGSLESMQAIVGGYVEAVHVHALRGVDLFCNEDGIELELPGNGCGIRGSYFFVRHNAEGNPVSLTNADIARIKDYLTAYRSPLIGNCWSCVPADNAPPLS